MPKKDSALLIEQNMPTSLERWDDIVRAVVMFTDVVWLHSALDISNKIDDSSKHHISIVLNELVEDGIIKFYSLESDEDSYIWNCIILLLKM